MSYKTNAEIKEASGMTEKELEKLYNEAYKAVYWTAISLLKNKEDAEDVVQDTFITAFQSYDSLEDKSKALAWVKKICANKCLNILTRTKTFYAEDEFFENEAVDDDFLPASIADSKEKRRIIMDIINRCLSDAHRITIILFYFDEMTVNEIAARLSIPQGTVLSRLNNAKRKIKKEVEAYEKRTNDKLFGMSIPFLTLLFEKEAEDIPFKPIPASLSKISASKTAKAAAKKAVQKGGAKKLAATAAEKGGKLIVIKKIVIAVAAVAVVGSGVAVAVHHFVSNANTGNMEREITAQSGEDEIVTNITTEDTDATDATTDVTDSKPAANVVTQCGIELSIPGGDIAKIHYRDYNKNDYDCGYEYYDADGRLVFEEHILVDGKFSQIFSYEYDDQGRVVKEIKWGVKNVVPDTTTVYEYGANGPVKTEVYNINNELTSSLIYEYDGQNRVAKETKFRAGNSTADYSYEYEYADDGSYTRWFHYQDEDDRNGTYEKYTADGLMTETYRPGDGTANMKSEQTIWEYDSNGNVVSCVNNMGDALNYTIAYEYDAQGRRISNTQYNAGGDMSYEYTYEFTPAD